MSSLETRKFFTSRQVSEVRDLHDKYTAYYESGKAKSLGPHTDFTQYRYAALFAHIVGDHERAGQLLCAAVKVGFPPDWKIELKDEWDRQRKNHMDGVSALRVGLAAQILGMKDRRDEILNWAVEHLLDTELLTEEADPQHSDVTLDRAYALLAAGRFWPKMDSDLALVAGQIHKATDNSCTVALPRALIALVQGQKGIVSRREATTSLVQLILDAKRDVHHRVEACFHVLYLQSAFPDVFEPVLPPLVSGQTTQQL